MAQTLLPAVESRFLTPSRVLTKERDGYRYRIVNDGKQVGYTVSKGEQSLHVMLKWAFGSGHSGQTYVYEQDGRLFESRMSYYPRIDALDRTIGAANEQPTNLAEAAGREMSSGDIRDCFGCHSSHGRQDGGFNFDAMIPGVRCTHCHTGTAEHLAGVGTKEMSRPENPGLGSSEDILEFCGSCHRTWADVMMLGIKGVNNVRFQPYRLSLSPCYDPADARLNCVSCHDPHQAVVSDAESYDRVCQTCHKPGQPSVCPTAASRCVDCHMPKTELPGAHFAFRDHNIRVVRAGEPYPE